MPYSLNNKLSVLKPYDPIEGDYKIRLDANESYYNINDDISKLISQEISKLKLNRYPDPYAQASVKAFADFYCVNKDLVTAGNGSDELISIITSCFLESGDKVVTLSPDFSMYSFYGSLYELEVLSYKKNEETLDFDIDNLIEYCNSSKARMLIFSNPCNPTSLGKCRSDILKLLDNIKCLVVVDEAYMDFFGESIMNNIEQYDNLIVLKTCSKAIGLAGIRFGFAVAGETITTALKAAKSPYNTDMISQKIVEVAFSQKNLLQSKITEIIEQRRILEERLHILAKKCKAFEKIYCSKANFIFIKTDRAKEIYNKLLEKSIAVRCFDGHLRISTGTAKENTELFNALENIL